MDACPYVCTVDVPAIDALLDRLTAHGGTLALPKMAIPQVGWLAYAKDPEGNIFVFMQSDLGRAESGARSMFISRSDNLALLEGDAQHIVREDLHTLRLRRPGRS